MRTDTTFKRAFNDMIEIIRTLDLGEELPSENALRAQLGVSRTTVRKVLAGMAARGIIMSEAHRRIIRKQPRQKERYPKEETLAISEQVETSFMEWMLRGDAFRAQKSMRRNWPGNSASRQRLSVNFSTDFRNMG